VHEENKTRIQNGGGVHPSIRPPASFTFKSVEWMWKKFRTGISTAKKLLDESDFGLDRLIINPTSHETQIQLHQFPQKRLILK
jgi:hypothetical protein